MVQSDIDPPILEILVVEWIYSFGVSCDLDYVPNLDTQLVVVMGFKIVNDQS